MRASVIETWRCMHRVTGGKYDPAVRPLAEHFQQAPADEDPQAWLLSDEGQAAAKYSQYSAFNICGAKLVCGPDTGRGFLKRLIVYRMLIHVCYVRHLMVAWRRWVSVLGLQASTIL